jgi:shikimate kinase
MAMQQNNQPALPDTKLILFGVKHSGKTSIGKILSSRVNWPFRDLDNCIEIQTQALMGFSLRDFVRIEEKGRFLSIEANCLDNFLQNRAAPWILATGGGIIDNEAAIRLIPADAVKVYLFSEPQILFERIMKHGLPPFLSPENPWESFLRIYESRNSRYRELADVIIDRKDLSREETTERLITHLKDYFDAR